MGHLEAPPAEIRSVTYLDPVLARNDNGQLLDKWLKQIGSREFVMIGKMS